MQHLIAKIYDCVMQPNLWPEVLQEVAPSAGAFGAMIFDCKTQNGQDFVRLRPLSSIQDTQIVAQYITAQNACELRDQARFALLSSQGMR